MAREYRAVYQKVANSWRAFFPAAMKVYLSVSRKAERHILDVTDIDFTEFDPGHGTRRNTSGSLLVSLSESLPTATTTQAA